MTNLLHHVSLAVSDLQKSKRLYDAALFELGFRCVCKSPDFAGYGIEENKDKFAINKMSDARAASPGFHLAFSAPSRDAVNRFHQVALEHGATDNGAPGLREHYGPDYYSAFIVDLDGNRIEAVINEPPKTELRESEIRS